MKLLTFDEMMSMPHGTIAQTYTPHLLGEPFVFGGPIGDNDYVQSRFFPSPGTASYHNDPAILEKWSLKNSDLTIKYPSNFGRNGLYETKKRFLVWEGADRAKLAAWLLDPDLCAREQNDDPHAMIASEIYE